MSNIPRRFSDIQIWFFIQILGWPFYLASPFGSLRLNLVLGLIFGAWILIRDRIVSLSTVRFSILLASIVAIFIFTGHYSPCLDGHSKSITTAVPLWFLLVISWQIGVKALPKQWIELRKASEVILLIVCLSIIFELLFPGLSSTYKLKYHAKFQYSGLFAEPSHLGIGIFPCIALLLDSENRTEVRKGIFYLLFCLILSRSSTLVVCTALWVAYHVMFRGSFSKRVKSISAAGATIAILLFFGYDLIIKPLVDRVEGIAQGGGTTGLSENVSSMVYLKGVEDAIYNFERTKGLGLGFNMMGCTPLPIVPARLVYLGNKELIGLNDFDGSFLLSKIVSEFGLFGCLSVLWLIVHWWISEKRLKRISNIEVRKAMKIGVVLLFCSFSVIFFRGTVYFQGGIVLLATVAPLTIGFLRNSKSSKYV